MTFDELAKTSILGRLQTIYGKKPNRIGVITVNGTVWVHVERKGLQVDDHQFDVSSAVDGLSVHYAHGGKGVNEYSRKAN